MGFDGSICIFDFRASGDEEPQESEEAAAAREAEEAAQRELTLDEWKALQVRNHCSLAFFSLNVQ